MVFKHVFRKIFVLLSMMWTGKSSAYSLLNIVADDELMYQIIDNIIKFLKVFAVLK